MDETAKILVLSAWECNERKSDVMYLLISISMLGDELTSISNTTCTVLFGIQPSKYCSSTRSILLSRQIKINARVSS